MQGRSAEEQGILGLMATMKGARILRTLPLVPLKFGTIEAGLQELRRLLVIRWHS